jgi:hypothetical protein
MFHSNSRYYNSEKKILKIQDGREISYIPLRILPSLEANDKNDAKSLFSQIDIKGNDRLDLISAKIFGDPEQFWRICDVNIFLHPIELTSTLGQKILLPTLLKQ